MGATRRLVVLACLGVLAGLGACSRGGGGDPPSLPVESTGTIDSSFGVQGVAVTRANVTVREIVVVDDGYLVGGPGPYVTKLGRDGSLDTTFAQGGTDSVRRGTKSAQGVTKIAPLPGGSIVVVETHNGSSSAPMAFRPQEVFGDLHTRRTDARGNLDASYGQQGAATLPYSEGAVVISPQGRVVSFSMRPRLFESNLFAVAALDPNGVADPAFEARALESVQQCGSRLTPPNAAVNQAAAAQSGAKTVVATLWMQSTPATFVCITRLNADGTLDTAFGNGGHQVFDDTFELRLRILRVVMRSDNAVVVTLGPGANGGLEPTTFFFLTPSGAKDVSALPQGRQSVTIGVVHEIHDVALQDNGKVLTVGLMSAAPGPPTYPLDQSNPRITRSFPFAGIYDAGFGPFRGGYTPLATTKGGLRAERVVIDRDGAILVGGQLAASFESAVVKLR